MESPHGGWPDPEAVMSRLRHWLDETISEAESLGEQAGADAIGDQVGLFQVVERLTSLRHEMKLLTKAARGGEERTEATLVSMQAAIEQFQGVEAEEERAAQQAARPLVEGLLDLDQSLRRGQLAIEDARRRMLERESADRSAALEELERLFQSQPWWRRRLCRRWLAAVRQLLPNPVDHTRAVFDSLLDGYQLIQSRLQRTMDEQEIARMQCVGHPADPNSMTVVETVSDPSRPPGVVVEEVRTGYFWKAKVFRFAEVKAVGER